METLSALIAICSENLPVANEIDKGLVMWSQICTSYHYNDHYIT